MLVVFLVSPPFCSCGESYFSPPLSSAFLDVGAFSPSGSAASVPALGLPAYVLLFLRALFFSSLFLLLVISMLFLLVFPISPPFFLVGIRCWVLSVSVGRALVRKKGFHC